MLRLAGIRPLVRAFGLSNVRPSVNIARSYSSPSTPTNEKTESPSILQILADIEAKPGGGSSQHKKDLVPTDESESYEEEEEGVIRRPEEAVIAERLFGVGNAILPAYERYVEEHGGCSLGLGDRVFSEPGKNHADFGPLSLFTSKAPV